MKNTLEAAINAGVDLKEANLNGADLQYADLKGATMTGPPARPDAAADQQADTVEEDIATNKYRVVVTTTSNNVYHSLALEYSESDLTHTRKILAQVDKITHYSFNTLHGEVAIKGSSIESILLESVK